VAYLGSPMIDVARRSISWTLYYYYYYYCCYYYYYMQKGPCPQNMQAYILCKQPLVNAMLPVTHYCGLCIFVVFCTGTK